jgi:hypothetical protein
VFSLQANFIVRSTNNKSLTDRSKHVTNYRESATGYKTIKSHGRLS